METIVAPATPLGRSALAIVRLDGSGAVAILEQLTGETAPTPRHATLVRLYEPSRTTDNGQRTTAIDECIAIVYHAPHSFTGNDLVELTLHGNPLLVERVIAACVTRGARMAEAGEFSERAVLNGKMDLVQAESVADLINARTTLQAKLSLSNLEGLLSRKAAAIRATLLDVISRLEAALDFSEEGYEFITTAETRARLEAALADTSALADTYRRGHATRAGLSAVILGRPNAGKSTLLNRLVGSDRAIVTPIPGTTRDIVRETIEMGGLPVTLADTAGLRESADVVEGIGIERAREAARTADIVVYLVDATVGLTEDDRRELAGFGMGPMGPMGATPSYESPRSHVLVVYTKADLAAAPEGLAISAVSGAGVDELLRRLDELVRERFAAPEGSLVNERQRQAVAECEAGLRVALESVEAGMDEQMIVVDLYRAANALGALTGAITREDVLTEIFGRFCIGK
jgi:tRNA modification GTPase